MSNIMQILGTSTPVSEILAEKIGFIRAGIACRIFFYQQLKNGVCSASIATIAKKLGLASGTVSTNIKWLRENGYIDTVGEHKSGNVTNKYIVTQKFYDSLEHSLDESEHSLDESNIQQVKGKEEIKEETKEETTSGGEVDESFKAITTVYENEIGLLSPIIAQKIGDCTDDYPTEWIAEAIGIAATQNKRKWVYIEGILRKWKAEGKQDKPTNGNGNGSKPKVQPEPIPIINSLTGEIVGYQ